MIRIKPFKAIRPRKDIAKEVSSRPYDVMNSIEAQKEAGEKSLLHITRPEISFNPIIDEHTDEAYNKAVENFKKWQDKGWLTEDKKENYYIYAQTMDGKTQYGLLACAHIDDYLNNKIKKHEFTRPDKEEDRMVHIRNQNANLEPVFFAYRDVAEMNEIVESVVKKEPEYSFIADEDNFGHHFWCVEDEATINKITKIFENIPELYIADGHHRTAAAALVGQEKRRKNPNHTGNEEYNYFMMVAFPESHLRIIDYNRVIKDLNGLTPTELLDKIKANFIVEEKSELYKPNKLHNFSMYLDGKWYSLTAKEGTYNDNDPIGVLDVTVLSEQILSPLLDIKDLRTSNRIDFVGGIRGLGELKKRVDSGEMEVAFALYPVSMKQLMDISDTGNIMPPKTTWFEPKLRSGLAIHKLE